MIKIGHGIDIHDLFEKEGKQKLGGVETLSKYMINAHSDGDIIIHSICSALIGALSLKDLGYYFPDTKKENTNISSIEMLNFFLDILKKENYMISNIDITIICNKILISPIRNKIVSNLKKILNCEHISVKGTRFEKNNNSQMQIHCYCSLLIFK